MPFIHVRTSGKISEKQKQELKTDFGRKIELLPGKTEQWLMIQFEGECGLFFQGSDQPCALLDIAVYGSAGSGAYGNLTRALSGDIERVLGIPASRIYVKYAETQYWGWDKENF